MALREELRKQGNWLFRWRSYLPLITVVIVLLGMSYFEYPGHSRFERQDLVFSKSVLQHLSSKAVDNLAADVFKNVSALFYIEEVHVRGLSGGSIFKYPLPHAGGLRRAFLIYFPGRTG